MVTRDANECMLIPGGNGKVLSAHLGPDHCKCMLIPGEKWKVKWTETRNSARRGRRRRACLGETMFIRLTG